MKAIGFFCVRAIYMQSKAVFPMVLFQILKPIMLTLYKSLYVVQSSRLFNEPTMLAYFNKLDFQCVRGILEVFM